jgi:hypothetical protein
LLLIVSPFDKYECGEVNYVAQCTSTITISPVDAHYGGAESISREHREDKTHPCGYGTVVLGTIPADGSPVTYSFNGNFGDLVTIRAVGVTPGADPNLTLFGPAQQQLAFNDNEPFLPLNTAALVVYRLQASGPHYVLVGGTQGDFLLTLDVRPPMTATTLQLDTPTEVHFHLLNPHRSLSLTPTRSLPPACWLTPCFWAPTSILKFVT